MQRPSIRSASFPCKDNTPCAPLSIWNGHGPRNAGNFCEGWVKEAFVFNFFKIVCYTGLEMQNIKSNFQVRSEEHTSELQSRFDLVCRLLLEKKKKENTHM